MQIELQKEEAQVLLNMINIAVQTKGLEAAEVGVHFAKKIQAAAKADEPASNVIDMPAAKEA